MREPVVERFGLSYAHIGIDRWLASLFLHGDVFHVLGNMWFLYLFGFAVEGRLRFARFLLLYFAAGAAGDALHLGLFGAAFPTVPVIGASGAIMGCLGAALYLFPHARVEFLFSFTIYYWRVVTWKMMWVAAYYFGMDLLFAFLNADGGGGVANLAHIGGAIGGLLVCAAFRTRRDSEYASDAKATLDESKDLGVLSPRELEDLHGANPSDSLVVLHWMARSMKDHRGPNQACRTAFQSHLPRIVEEQDPQAVATLLSQVGLAGLDIAPAAILRLAMRLEDLGDKAMAFRIYEHLIAIRPPDDEYQVAIFRSALILENVYFNFERAAQAYRFLDTEYPMGSFSDQARSRLAALVRTGRTT